MVLAANVDSAYSCLETVARQTPPVAPISSFPPCFILLCMETYTDLSVCSNAKTVLRSPRNDAHISVIVLFAGEDEVPLV
jgi:hypothetical protein